MWQWRPLSTNMGMAFTLNLEDIPEVMPLWSGFFTDPEGRLWVQRFRPAGGDPTGLRTWEIYDSEGAYLGALGLALASDPTPAVRNDRLVGAVTDDLDVPYIVVFELLTGGS